jgi:para-aminobenzoate synthetase component 1
MIHLEECEPFDAARLARGLAALGVRDTALFASTLPGGGERGRWTLVAFGAIRRLAFDGRGWSVAGRPASAALGRFEAALEAHGPRAWSGLVAAEIAGVGPPVPEAVPAGAPPFRGGFALALSYDLLRAEAHAGWRDRVPDDGRWPLLELRLFGAAGAIDHASGRAWWVAADHPFFAAPAIDRARAAGDVAARALAAAPLDDEPSLAPPADPAAALRSNLDDGAYARAFDRVQEYLRAGDLYQANLTRRFDAPCALDGPALWSRLRRAAPAPYAALLDGTDRAIVSASPELFLARTGERLVTRPIKGTRPRDPDPARDSALAAELQASAKDRAEHVMIVDVHRNDLGRVCTYGSVRVPALAAHEAFPTVHHLTSTIEGRYPRARGGAWPAIRAAFPAGSISGAPKLRACEVIEELEPTRRALYCGALGWWDLGGDFALNVAIRTILLADGTAAFQAGGGIVIDSEVRLEAAETWNKARALHAAITGAPLTPADVR